MRDNKIILALPKGRILQSLMPILKAAQIEPEDSFYDSTSRALRFKTSNPSLDVIRVRSFDVATFVTFGAAHIGVCGSDVVEEFHYEDLYAPLDLGVAGCELSLACMKGEKEKLLQEIYRCGHVRVATKYPNITRHYFHQKGIQATCIKLNGAMELAPVLNLTSCIVDVVSTGKTLFENGLEVMETIFPVTSRLVVNRSSLKTRAHDIHEMMDRLTQERLKVNHGDEA